MRGREKRRIGFARNVIGDWKEKEKWRKAGATRYVHMLIGMNCAPNHDAVRPGSAALNLRYRYCPENAVENKHQVGGEAKELDVS